MFNGNDEGVNIGATAQGPGSAVVSAHPQGPKVLSF